MTEHTYKAWREYESRITDTEYANTLEMAKTLARNMVHLEQPREWVKVEDSYNKWKLDGYGERGENCYIKKKTVKTEE